MNRLTPHEQDERRRKVKARQKAERRKTRKAQKPKRVEKRTAAVGELEFKLRGLAQWKDYRAAREYAAVLQAKKELL